MHAFVNKTTGEIPIPAQADPFPSWQINHFTGVNKGFALGQCGNTDWWIVEATVTTPTPGPYQVVIEGKWTWDGASDLVTRTDTLANMPLEQAKAQARQEVESIRDVRLAEGFGYDFAAPHGVKVMQTRPQDIPNWLGVTAASLNAMLAGLPDAPVGPIRVEDDTNIDVTAAQALPIMAALQQHHGAINKASWGLKDAINATTTVADLRAIDLTAGWPDSTLPQEPTP